MTPESDVKNEMKRVFKGYDAYVFMPVQTGYGARSVDFLACVGRIIKPSDVGRYLGVFVAVEAKKREHEVGDSDPDKLMTALQRRTLSEVTHAGGLSNCLNSGAVLDNWLRREGFEM